MAMQRRETVICPKCGRRQKITVWASLSAANDIAAKRRLLDGTLFRFVCAGCGYWGNVDYPVLYQDENRRAIVQYVDERDVERALADMDEEMPEEGYRKRIVTDQNALREKAVLFENGLDDRVAELIKLVYLSGAQKQEPDAHIAAAYFLAEDGAFSVELAGDMPRSVRVPKEMYDEFARAFAMRLQAAGDQDALVNMDWAIAFAKDRPI